MFKTQKKTDGTNNTLRVIYPKLSKLFLITSILFIIWILFVAMGTFILEMGPNWALLNLENWIIAWCVLTVIFIILEVVFYFQYTSKIDKKLELDKPELEFLHDKRVHVYTYPTGAEGGIFSKTYISIDENSVLRLRGLMIPQQELGGKKEKN
jgi:hypothetical protein